MRRPHAIVFFGPPAAGKGTQASMLARALRVEHVSTGAISRSLDPNSSFYERVQEEIEHSKRTGAYFPDETAVEMLERAIERNGYDSRSLLILDGIPRTLGQVELVGELVDVHLIFNLFADDDDALIERMRSRGERDYDSDRDVALARIADYRALTEPIVDAYRERGMRVYDMDALAGSKDAINRVIIDSLIGTAVAGWFADYKTI